MFNHLLFANHHQLDSFFYFPLPFAKRRYLLSPVSSITQMPVIAYPIAMIAFGEKSLCCYIEDKHSYIGN